MAAIRAVLLFVALAGSFLVGAPLQWLVARRWPRVAHVIPNLFCRTLLAILKVRVVVSGARAAHGPVMIAANHVSWIDILAFGSLMPFCFLAKSDVASWPILSAFAEVQGTVFVDRRRRRSIPRANRDMARRLREGRTVLLFPEGTTLAGPLPGPFKSSHFAAARDLMRLHDDVREVAVQPVAIAYSSPAAAWIGDDALLPHLWRTLRGAPLRCVVTFGAPIGCALDDDRKQVARSARDSIIGMLETKPVAASRVASVSADLGAPMTTSC